MRRVSDSKGIALSPEEGFTLLELLVAVAVASVVFVVLLSGFSLNMKSTGLSEDYTTAVMLAKAKMVELETQKELQPGKSKGDFGEEYPRFRWVVEVVPDSTKPFYRATLRVIFTRGGTDREVVLKTVFLEKNRKNPGVKR